MTMALEGGEGSASHPGCSLPLGKTRYPLYRRLGGPQGRSGQVRKISPPIGIRSLDRPARRQSLYRLHYPDMGVCLTVNEENINVRWLINTSPCKDNILCCLNLGSCLDAMTTRCICGQPKGSTS